MACGCVRASQAVAHYRDERRRSISSPGPSDGRRDGAVALARAWSAGFRSMRRNSVEHPANADVFIDVRPVDPRSIADDLIVRALLRRHIRQAVRPRQRDADRASIGQVRRDQIIGNFDRSGARIASRSSRSAPARPPECEGDAPR